MGGKYNSYVYIRHSKSASCRGVVSATKMDDEKSASLKQKLKLYGNYISPVCRVVMWLLEAERIPYEVKSINLAKGK